jgi:hypothetical protein
VVADYAASQSKCRRRADAKAADVLSIVKHALKLVAFNRIGRRSSNEINMKFAITADDHHSIRKWLAAIVALCARVRAGHHNADEDNVRWLWHFLCSAQCRTP